MPQRAASLSLVTNTTVDSDREAPEESCAASEEKRDEVSPLLLRRLRDVMSNINDTIYDVTSNAVLEKAHQDLLNVLTNLNGGCSFDGNLRILRRKESEPTGRRRAHHV